MFLLLGLLEDEPAESLRNLGILKRGHSRYIGLKEYLEENVSHMTDPKKANVLILPYKFKGLKDDEV